MSVPGSDLSEIKVFCFALECSNSFRQKKHHSWLEAIFTLVFEFCEFFFRAAVKINFQAACFIYFLEISCSLCKNFKLNQFMSVWNAHIHFMHHIKVNWRANFYASTCWSLNDVASVISFNLFSFSRAVST